MSMKVQVKNYQIIKNAEAEFVPGLNVIVGPSNNGKTSFIKAIKSLIYTEPGSTPIRFGTQSYIVGIQYNGHTVILQKGLKDSAYLVDGEKFTKYGTSTPEEVSKALGIRELELNGKKEKINFWDQMNYPFLLDKSSTELFRFIVDSGEDDQISAALKDMVSDRQGINKDINQLQGSIMVLDEQIATKTKEIDNLKPKLDVSKEIIKMQTKVANVRQMNDLLEKIKSLQSKQLELQKQYNKVEAESKIYTESVLKLQDSYEKSSIYSNTLQRINDFKNRINQNDQILSKYKITFDLLESVSEVNLEPLIKVRDSILNLQSKVNLLSNQKSSTLDIDTKKVEENLLTLTNYKTSLQRFSANRTLKSNSETMMDSVNKILDKITKLQSNIQVCPYCGQAIHNI